MSSPFFSSICFSSSSSSSESQLKEQEASPTSQPTKPTEEIKNPPTPPPIKQFSSADPVSPVVDTVASSSSDEVSSQPPSTLASVSSISVPVPISAGSEEAAVPDGVINESNVKRGMSPMSDFCYSDGEVSSDEDDDEEEEDVRNPPHRTTSSDSINDLWRNINEANETNEFLGIGVSMDERSRQLVPTPPPRTSPPRDSSANSPDLSMQILRAVPNPSLTTSHSPLPTPSPAPPLPRASTVINVNFSDVRANTFVHSNRVNGCSTVPSSTSTSTDESELSKSWKFEENPKSKPLVPDDFSKSEWVHDVLNPPPEPKKVASIPLKLIRRSITGAKPVRTPPTYIPTTFQKISTLSPTITSQLDTQMKGLISDLKVLAKHLASPRPVSLGKRAWSEVQRVVNDLHRLVEIPQRGVDAARDEMTASEIKTKEERELFIALDGPAYLQKLIRQDPTITDARTIYKSKITEYARPYNDTLLLLRELCYINPELSDTFKTDFIVYLFTMLHHRDVFEHTIGLIEEVLSLQPPSNLFFAGEVPDLFSLLQGFSCKQMGHFCRVLALLVFEPEDRFLMESSTVLKSVELLQLRRDRQGRTASTIDRNQAAVLGMTDLIPRIVTLLKILNFCPPICQRGSFHIIGHVPSISELLVSLIGFNEIKNWDDVDDLIKLAKKASPYPGASNAAANTTSTPASPNPTSPAPATPSPTISSPSLSESSFLGSIQATPSGSASQPSPSPAPPAEPTRNSVADMLENLAPHFADRSSLGGMNLALVVSIYNAAQRVGVLDADTPIRENDQWSGVESRLMARMNDLERSRRRPQTPDRAADELQFNALMLAQYQVEILFLLCTILGGRRKIDMQRKLHELGIISVLTDMFDRLAWGTNADPTEFSALHGPGCECNPESALRVQYLRVLHNYCDRDCDNYFECREMLSEDERRYLGFTDNSSRGDMSCFNRPPPHPSRRGLLFKLVQVLMKEPADSQYRFWLASCIEAFLRGSTDIERMYVARYGLMDFLSEEILSDKLRCAGSLQTSFDLLGELVKGDSTVLAYFVKRLSEEKFERLMSVSTANLVDSNVFIRSLLISLEREKYKRELKRSGTLGDAVSGRDGRNRGRSYLTHSWWEVEGVSLDNDDSDNGVNFELGDEEGSETKDVEGVGEDFLRRRMGGLRLYEIDTPDWYCTFEEAMARRERVGSSRDAGRINNSLVREDLSAIGSVGWKFSPLKIKEVVDDAESYQPNTLSRIRWFLSANQTRLLRHLMSIVDLGDVNHENICVLNTVIVILIFVNRKGEDNLKRVLRELRRIDAQEDGGGVVLEGDVEREKTGKGGILRNFRQLLFFWREYYTHRGRDRLSLEFSSHLRFAEWNNIVTKLCADDGSEESLMDMPIDLPRSPYSKPPRQMQGRGGTGLVVQEDY
eukprot:CAMPEP_0118668016 /NCGR_PEP_ID=MMETSP0785-20121206/20114_1 /TAXON_ID=91992 /ORGANISM="Bolidomonas pacifica, Strain CCMP 1866" /LENGTH=1410 /DNA_ID=CAMNT_0006562547 /DNA_START=278 /DNA_END=4510 /DNA_ORIENTATION=-